MSAVACGLSIIKYKLVSSANNLIVDCMSITILLSMYIEKNISFASHDFFSGNDIAFQRKTFHFGNETRFRF
jgi:hypothetical protein